MRLSVKPEDVLVLTVPFLEDCTYEDMQNLSESVQAQLAEWGQPVVGVLVAPAGTEVTTVSADPDQLRSLIRDELNCGIHRTAAASHQPSAT